MQKNKSPYSASFTAISLAYNEMNAILPLLLSDQAEPLIKEEIRDNKLLKINSEQARKRVLIELRKRFNVLDVDFWNIYLSLSEKEQRILLFYNVLKCYLLLTDLHFNVALPKWRSVNHVLSSIEVLSELYELSAKDAFVDSWTEKTKKKITSVYLLMLRQCGMINESTAELQPLKISDELATYFVKHNELWFLDACLLPVYEIDRIKERSLQ